MAKKQTPKKPVKKTGADQTKKPRILVLEGAGGAATNAVLRSGAIPVRVFPRDVAAVESVLKARKFDGLLLCGGGDVDPGLYGEAAHPRTYGVSKVRDYCEWEALDVAAEMKIPVMGICRGMQLIAVHNGGMLKQHVDKHRGNRHRVVAERGSTFGKVIGRQTPIFESLHHQVVRRHGAGMKVSCRSPRGLIEGIESTDGRVLAVQFHPEYDYGTNEASRLLFDWLAQASAARAGKVKPERLSSLRSAGVVPAERRAPERPQVKNLRGVKQSHYCRECGLLFDKQQDRDDHEYWICGTPELRVAEPPPGHPDWGGKTDEAKPKKGSRKGKTK